MHLLPTEFKPTPPQPAERLNGTCESIAALPCLEPQGVHISALKDCQPALQVTLESDVNSASPQLRAAVDCPLPPFSSGGAIDLATITRAHVLAVLNQHAGNKARAARALGINRRSLYRLLEKYEKCNAPQMAH